MPTTDRITDTLDYLRTKVTAPQFNEIDALVNVTPNKPALSNDLSIGNKNPFRKPGRRAKRCLMLLARLLIEDQNHRTQEIARCKSLPENSEAPLVAIGKMAKWNNYNYYPEDAVRGVYKQDKEFNCYSACVFWAFQAGAISRRYLWNKSNYKNGIDFFPVFSQVGWDTVIKYSGGNLIKDDYQGGEIMIPAGLTVYFETPTKVFGHIACSLGDGSVISQNSVLPAAGLANLDPLWAEEVHKMTVARTHIISIRYMMALHYNHNYGYPKLKVLNNAFWMPIAANKR
jgi:hypothetical protein